MYKRQVYHNANTRMSSNLGLKFCGFEANSIFSHFKLSYNNEDDLYNLDKWQAYEEANPRTFIEMYQFWCQKIA